MRVLVTGACGFVGKNVTDALYRAGHDVIEFDKAKHEAFDLDKPMGLRYMLSASDAVIHLAANADVRGGWSDPKRDLKANLLATSNLLEAMRATGCKRLIFASSGSVYGPTLTPTPESRACHPSSLYGASKLAAEALISAYATAGHLSATAFRFVSMLGPGYKHGHVVDFRERLAKDPTRLEILGTGASKSYVDVSDVVDAIMLRLDADPGFEVLNCGTDSAIPVTLSARWICDELGVDPEIVVGAKSWVGDDTILLDCARLRSLGWEPKFSIREAIARTL